VLKRGLECIHLLNFQFSRSSQDRGLTYTNFIFMLA